MNRRCASGRSDVFRAMGAVSGGGDQFLHQDIFPDQESNSASTVEIRTVLRTEMFTRT